VKRCGLSLDDRRNPIFFQNSRPADFGSLFVRIQSLLSPIKTAYQYAFNNGLGGLKGNPARSITVEGVVVGTRDDFTKEEERTILIAARDQRNEIRWFTWWMACSRTGRPRYGGFRRG
jgi:hypothetical protein